VRQGPPRSATTGSCLDPDGWLARIIDPTPLDRDAGTAVIIATTIKSMDNSR